MKFNETIGLGVVSFMLVLRRKKFLTHRRLQIKLAAYASLTLGVLLLGVGFVFLISHAQMNKALNGFTTSDTLVLKSVLLEQTQSLTIWYAVLSAIYLAFVSVLVILYSHRLTGPIYKLTKILEISTVNRQWPQLIRFRQDDEFQELAYWFNQFVIHFSAGSDSKKKDVYIKPFFGEPTKFDLREPKSKRQKKKRSSR